MGQNSRNVILNFDAIFEFLRQFTIRCIYFFFQNGVNKFDFNNNKHKQKQNI